MALVVGQNHPGEAFGGPKAPPCLFKERKDKDAPANSRASSGLQGTDREGRGSPDDPC